MDNSIFKAVEQAKKLHEAKKYREEAGIYRDLVKQGMQLPQEAIISYAWSLYFYAKEELQKSKIDSVKSILYEYIKLNIASNIKSQRVSSPDNFRKEDNNTKIHHAIMFLAKQIKKVAADKFSMSKFVKLWDLECLSPQDFIPDDKYPSLVHSIVKDVVKDMASDDKETAEYILPYIDKLVQIEPKNIWVKYYNAKCLIVLGNTTEAAPYVKEVVKNRPDPWAWELLANIYINDEDTALSCYCRALQSTKDLVFIKNIKLSLAGLLIKKQDYSRAKVEIQEVVDDCTKSGYKVSEWVQQTMREPWYETTELLKSNRDFYADNGKIAEEIIYQDIPWQDAVLGPEFVDKKNKKRRTIYLITPTDKIKIQCSASKIPAHLSKEDGTIRVKAGADSDGKYMIYLVQKSDSSEIKEHLIPKIAVVEYINYGEKTIHCLVDKGISFAIPMSELDSKVKPLDVIEVYLMGEAENQKAMFIKKSNQDIPAHLIREFKGDIHITNDVGFVRGSDNIFVPPTLLEGTDITDGAMVSGKAIINYNRKKSQWGWKAYTIALDAS